MFLSITQPPVRFEKIAGTKFHRLVPPDQKKCAAYYQALKQQNARETEMAQ
jgi:hypothetical protein